MRALLIVSLFTLAAACAGPPVSKAEYGETTTCIDGGGQQLPVVCDKVGRTRAGQDQGFCTCVSPSIRVTATPCGLGEKQPKDSPAFREVLRDATKDGSLLGDTFEGQPICMNNGNT